MLFHQSYIPDGMTQVFGPFSKVEARCFQLVIVIYHTTFQIYLSYIAVNVLKVGKTDGDSGNNAFDFNSNTIIIRPCKRLEFSDRTKNTSL